MADGAVLRPRPPRSACPTGSSGGCGSARRSRSARGGWCACSTRSPGARAAPATWPAACSTCSTRTSSPTWGARRSRCWPRRRCRGCCCACTAGCATRAGWWWPAAFALVLTSTGRRRQRRRHRVAAARRPRCWSVYELGWGAVAPGAARALRGAARAGRGASPRCGGSRPCSSTRATAWTSCPTPSSRGRSGARPRCPSRCGCWASGRATSASATRARCAPSRPTPASTSGSRRSSLATLVFPALCLGSFAWTRRARYAPFFLALVLLGLLVMFVGFPEGAPLRRAATFTYNHVQAVRFLRTTLQGGAARVARPRGPRRARPCSALRPRLRAAGARRRGGAGGARVLAAGARRRPRPPARAPARRARGVARRRPRPRPHAAARPARHGPARPALRLLRLGRDLRPDPAGADRPARGDALHRARSPTCARSTCSGRPTRWSASSARCPGQLRPLLDLMGVGAVVQGADDDRSRSGAVPASSAAGGPAARSARRRARTGRGARCPARPGRSSPPRGCRRSAAGTCRPAAWCACCRATGATVVDGSAPAIADLAAFGALRTDRALRYAADLDEPALRAQAARGGVVRHQRLQPPARLRRRAPARQHRLDRARRREALRGRRAARPVPAPRDRRADRRARGRRCGVGPRRLLARLRPVPRAPPVRGARRRPVDRVAGRPRAGHRSPPPRRRASRRRATSTTSTSCPTATARVAWTAWRSTGASSPCATGWNRLHLGLRGVRALSVRIAHVVQPPTGEGGAGGIRELRIPGVRATEALRPPRARRARAARRRPAPRGADLPLRPHHRRRPAAPARRHRRALARASCATSRTASAAGRARSPRPRRARGAPTRGSAWRPRRPDHVLDALDRRAAARRRSTAPRASRASGATAPRRPSTAIRRRAWIAGWIALARRVASVAHAGAADDPHAAPRARPGARALPDPRARGRRRPADGAAGRGGRRQRRRCPAPLRARTVRIEVLDAAFPRGTPGIDRKRRAVGVGEVTRRRRPARRRATRRRSAAPRAAATARRSTSARARCACAWPRPPTRSTPAARCAPPPAAPRSRCPPPR